MEIVQELFFLVCIFALGLVLRYIPHLKFDFPSTPDTFFTLQKLKDPEYEKDILTYPNFLHQFFRFFLRSTERISYRKLNMLTPLFDFFTGLVLYIFLRWAFGIEIALFSSLLFMITPFVVKQGITLSSRPFGLFFFTSSLLLLTLPVPLNWFATIPIALTLLTHRLSTQTLFVICLVFSIVDWQAGLIFVIGFGLAVLISKGHYLRILRSHIRAIIKYMRGEHYPNRRLIGIALVPTIAGFLINAIFRFMQLFIPFPLIIFGMLITPTMSINLYFENLLLVWGIVCTLLLICWIAGEAYKHTYFAGIPFAVFSVLLLQNSSIFWYLLLLLIIGCLSLSFYFIFGFQHLPKDLISVLLELKNVKDPAYFVIPRGYLRAGEYFSDKKGIEFDFIAKEATELVERISQEAITHIILNSEHLAYASKYRQLYKSGKWFLFSTNSK